MLKVAKPSSRINFTMWLAYWPSNTVYLDGIDQPHTLTESLSCFVRSLVCVSLSAGPAAMHTEAPEGCLFTRHSQQLRPITFVLGSDHN